MPTWEEAVGGTSPPSTLDKNKDELAELLGIDIPVPAETTREEVGGRLAAAVRAQGQRLAAARRDKLATGANHVETEPGPEVLRVQPLDQCGEPVGYPSSPRLTHIARLKEGWWWVRPDEQPDGDLYSGWEWNGNQMRGVHYWRDITADDAPALPAFRFGGPEPDPGIVRLAVRGGGGSDSDLARTRSGNWHWVRKGQPVEGSVKGWRWDGAAPMDVTFEPAYPRVDPMGGASRLMVASLAKALPDDEVWYRIGTDSRAGRNDSPVWAWRDSDDDWDVLSCLTDPNE